MDGDTDTLAPSYAAATDKLRDAAKWLLAAAAAVGGVLVAGLQLGSLGDLDLHQWGRLALALTGLILALIGVGMVIARAGALLTEDWITLAELSIDDFRRRLNRRREPRGGDVDAIYADIGRYREELYGYVATSPEDLYRKLTDANERSRRVRAGDSIISADQIRRDHDLHRATRCAVEYANYRRTRADFEALQKVLRVAGIAVVLGVVLFAVATHSAAPTTDQHSGAAPPSTSASATPGP